MADWFDSWAKSHCSATGADDKALVAIKANRSNFLGHWHATLSELTDCTSRLVRLGRTPKFASEHCDAIGRELHELRIERSKTAAADDRAHPERNQCNTCLGSGQATIPHPRCLIRVEGEWQIATDRDTGRVMSCVVPCDMPECKMGEAARLADKLYREKSEGRYQHKPITTLDDFEQQYRCDLVGMWRDYERDRIMRAKATAPVDTEWSRLCTSLITKAIRR